MLQRKGFGSLAAVAAAVVMIATLDGCASKVPPTLDATGQRAWQANEAVVVLGEVQHTAIEFNKIKICPSGQTSNCAPLFSDDNTRKVVNVVTSALLSLRAAPAGWSDVSTKALDDITAQLDAAGQQQISAYITAARVTLRLITGRSVGLQPFSPTDAAVVTALIRSSRVEAETWTAAH